MKTLKLLIAIELLPFVYGITVAFASVINRLGGFQSLSTTQPLLLFLGGVVACVVLFVALPRPMRLYVLGHELTHALWVWLLGGKVFSIKVTAEGGHIKTDTVNFWIALAPYFFPFYTFILLGLFLIASLFWNLVPYLSILYFLMGVTWGFHLYFTIVMIPTDQPDITMNGWVFSLVVIYIVNVLVLFPFVLLLSGKVGAGEACMMILNETVKAYSIVLKFIWASIVSIYHIIAG
ncbi:MAG: hypothetical protein SGI71_03905 [Verrucomicrobiota bacterium]|nr:hypothetical protein [Verrucomicrobiota bacterium]